MDLIILVGVVTALLVVLATLLFVQRRKNKEETQGREQQQPRAGRIAQDGAIPRRAQIARNQRNRLRQNAAAQNVAQQDVDSDDEDVAEDGVQRNAAVLNEKMGAKKRAKLEAKEQKRLWREQEMKEREDLKILEAKKEEEEKRTASLMAEKERKQAEAERLEREERERKEQEEYMKMKAAFSIEEEGYEEPDDAEKENLLVEFIKYIKNNKVVVLEDVAVEFKLKTQQVIERIQELQANGTITGVIDDRGKFIYISEDELLSVAQFIKQRGRVSIAELAESSNKLINLTPVASL